MRKVVLESPFAGDIVSNIAYAKAAIRDCLIRGEAPIASHLLFTQQGILDDDKPEERKLGMAAGHEWITAADAVVVYTDRGISSGMQLGISTAIANRIPIEYRSLPQEHKFCEQCGDCVLCGPCYCELQQQEKGSAKA